MSVLQEDRIVYKTTVYNPGVYRIFKEIVTNATDNKHRHPNTMDRVDIEINPDTGSISVKNNGKGIPIEWHKDAGCHIPTFLFSQMHSSSDFHFLGGRNGNGSKLANILSTEFKVECGDTSKRKTFSQTFRNNMREKDDPIIKTMTDAEENVGDYVKITFCPDLERFKMKCLDEDTVQVLSKIVYDVACSLACEYNKKTSVTLNGKCLLDSVVHATDDKIKSRPAHPAVSQQSFVSCEDGGSADEECFETESDISDDDELSNVDEESESFETETEISDDDVLSNDDVLSVDDKRPSLQQNEYKFDNTIVVR
jgi:DNA topoisomerase-2